MRVLAVDDWAWRKQQRYGSMLMDLEGRRVVDLLSVRSAASFAEWLRHSQIISGEPVNDCRESFVPQSHAGINSCGMLCRYINRHESYGS